MFDCDAQPELSEIPMRLGLPKSIEELFGKRKNNVAKLQFALAQTVESEVCFDAP